MSDFNRKITVTRSSMPDFEEYVEEIRDLWDSRYLTNMGPKHQLLEGQLADYLGTPWVSLFASGHSALEYVIGALKLEGEVITTPFTFVSTVHAIVRNGLRPVFCDVKPDTYTLDPDKLEALINARTAAIVPVHVYGNVCELDRIEEIARRHKLKVIYDAAHAFGVRVQGKGIGSFGDASIFSFHATKVFHTIEGGAVATADTTLKETLYCLRDFGITGPGSIGFVGGNAKLNEFQAAMGLCNLRHIEDEIKKREKVVMRYRQNLKDVAGIQTPQVQPGVTTNYAYFPVLIHKEIFGKSRDEVCDSLLKENILARKYFSPLISDLECYRGRFDSAETPVARSISERVICLPLYAGLEVKEVDQICRIILERKDEES